MISFKIFARKDKISKRGVPLVFILQPGGHKIKTGYYCRPDSWDHKAQSVISTGVLKDPKATHINAKLKRAVIALEDLIMKHESLADVRIAYESYLSNKRETPMPSNSDDSDITKSWGKKEWERFNKCKNKEVFMLFERVLFTHRADWSQNYQTGFRTTRSKIFEYSPYFEVSNLTENWFRDFINYCVETGSANNSLHHYSKNIRIFIKELRAIGYSFDPGLERRITWKYTDPNKCGLNWNQVLKIQSIDLSDHESYTIRDSRKLWIAAALTGRRWSEVLTMKPHNFYQKEDGQWRYKNIGKGQKIIDIPLLPEAVKFFKEIDFSLPTNITNNAVNADIRLICKKAGFKSQVLKFRTSGKSKVEQVVMEEWQTVTFHTARHSYGQHIAEIAVGKPHEVLKFISYMLGHSSFSVSWGYMNRATSSHDLMFQEIFKLPETTE